MRQYIIKIVTEDLDKKKNQLSHLNNMVKKFKEQDYLIKRKIALERNILRIERYIKRIFIEDELPIQIDKSLFISTEYLIELHPELSKEEAESLYKFSRTQTIRRKECYGDGSIIYPKWKEYKNNNIKPMQN